MAGRIRTFKPEMFEDEAVASLSAEAFRLFMAMISLADDHGNLRAAPAWLQGQVFHGRPNNLPTEELFAELAKKLVLFYEHDGQRYAHLNGWQKHQRVDNANEPRVPLPPGWTASREEYVQGGRRRSRWVATPGPVPTATPPDAATVATPGAAVAPPGVQTLPPRQHTDRDVAEGASGGIRDESLPEVATVAAPGSAVAEHGSGHCHRRIPIPITITTTTTDHPRASAPEPVVVAEVVHAETEPVHPDPLVTALAASRDLRDEGVDVVRFAGLLRGRAVAAGLNEARILACVPHALDELAAARADNPARSGRSGAFVSTVVLRVGRPGVLEREIAARHRPPERGPAKANAPAEYDPTHDLARMSELEGEAERRRDGPLPDGEQLRAMRSKLLDAVAPQRKASA